MVLGRSAGVRTAVNREVAASFALLASLVALGELTTLSPLSAPGELLLGGYGLVATLVPGGTLAPTTTATVLFVGYLYVLAVGVAWLVRSTGKS